MVDLLSLNPPAKPLPTGADLNGKIKLIGAGMDAGTGTLTCFTSTSVAANGSYRVLVVESGDFTVAIAQQGDGTWKVNVDLTGSFKSHSMDFVATATQTLNSITFVNPQDSGQKVTATQDQDRIDLNISSAPVNVSIQNNG